MAQGYNPGREQYAVTAAPNLVSEKARFDPNGAVDKLVSALGADSVQRELAAFHRKHEEKKHQEQALKLEWYVEQFSKDHTGGAVSQAQVKERFPETVPVIAARVAEAVGHQWGKKQFESVISEIQKDDALRLDSGRRSEFLKKKREELLSGIGEGNEFYGAGVVSALDKQIATHEQNWATETAAYHQKVQTDQFSDDVANALNSADPKTTLLRMDEKWGKSSSLNPLERNKVVVNTAIDIAFLNDDPKVLQSVPSRFLNADSKAALQKAQVALQDKRISDFRNAQYIKEVQRTEEIRSAKQEIVAAAAEGMGIDPAKYYKIPEAFEYAMQMREAPRLNESDSVATAQSIKNSVLTLSSTSQAKSLEDLQMDILTRPDLNPKERKALLEELPKLVEGRSVMSDEMVSLPVKNILNPALTALETSLGSKLETMLSGRNLRSEVMRGYETDIRRYFRAHYEETGEWPRGFKKEELIDRAVDRASARLKELTSIQSLGGSAGTPKPAASSANSPARPSPAPAPSAVALPPGVKLVQ